jgi:hypothetical protein
MNIIKAKRSPGPWYKYHFDIGSWWHHTVPLSPCFTVEGSKLPRVQAGAPQNTRSDENYPNPGSMVEGTDFHGLTGE